MAEVNGDDNRERTDGQPARSGPRVPRTRRAEPGCGLTPLSCTPRSWSLPPALSRRRHAHECHAQADGCPCALQNRAHCRGMMRYNEPLHLSSPASDALPADRVQLAALPRRGPAGHGRLSNRHHRRPTPAPAGRLRSAAGAASRVAQMGALMAANGDSHSAIPQPRPAKRWISCSVPGPRQLDAIYPPLCPAFWVAKIAARFHAELGYLCPATSMAERVGRRPDLLRSGVPVHGLAPRRSLRCGLADSSESGSVARD